MTAIRPNDSLEEEIYELLTFYCAAAVSSAKNEAPMPTMQCSSESLPDIRLNKNQ
jgi:hypothetical protein